MARRWCHPAIKDRVDLAWQLTPGSSSSSGSEAGRSLAGERGGAYREVGGQSGGEVVHGAWRIRGGTFVVSQRRMSLRGSQTAGSAGTLLESAGAVTQVA